MKKVGLFFVAVMLLLSMMPLPANAKIINYEDGSFELTELLVTEVASGHAQVRAEDCPTTSGDFIELYATEDVYLSDYQLLAKSGSSEKEIMLPDIEVEADSAVLLGCIKENEDENKKDVNLVNGGYVRIVKKAIDTEEAQEIDRVEYSPMGGG